MQSSKQIDFHITLNFCVAIEHFTYLASELSYEMLLALDTIDVFLVISNDGFSLFLRIWFYKIGILIFINKINLCLLCF